jgi:Ran GTPase-activating protein (RanGAP) involved in mRNA processing and transport
VKRRNQTKGGRPVLSNTRRSFFSSSKPNAAPRDSSALSIRQPSMRQISSRNLNASSGGITFDDEYGKSEKNSDRFDQEPWSISEKFTKQAHRLAEQFDVVKKAKKSAASLRHSSYRYFMRLPLVAAVVVNYNLFVHRYFTLRGRQEGNLAHGVASLGGQHADWRKDLTLTSKTRLIKTLRHHVINELRMSKLYFMSDHELVISFLDYTIDSSGLFTLVVLYDYNRMYWFLVVLLELTMYIIVGAVLKQFTAWQIRNYVFFSINVFFGMLTYFCNPYTEEKDRWLEFCGRILVSLVAIGLVIYNETSASLLKDAWAPVYSPWDNFHYFIELLTDSKNAKIGVVIDLLTVFYFYFYFIYILFAIGFFGMVDRTIQAVIFTYHDHVLDFLIDKLDERSFGMENIFSGLEFVQQWDDIIKLQRRYALFAWPDVRPSTLVSWSRKLFEIKWASLFNLTLKNLRSSLGLTILHTTMFQGDGEVSRWIMHTNPDLLLIQDSQNDTPITIALKECAYYLMVYGDQNEGFLDDHTTYGDDDYATFYPEVDEVRDEVFQNGEFIEELGYVHLLTSDELIRIRDDGVFIEPRPIDLAKEERELNEKRSKAKGGYNTLKFAKKSGYEEKMATKREKEMEKLIQLSKRKKKLIDIKNQTDKASLIQRRFPEDELYDNYETGQNSSWLILRYNVPMDNIFIDKYLYQRYLKFPNFHYENHFNSRRAIKNDVTDMKKKVALDDQEVEDFVDLEKNGSPEKEKLLKKSNETTDIFDRFIDKDIQYVIPGHKPIYLLDEKTTIPLENDKLQQLTKEFPDWDRKNRNISRRNSSFMTSGSDSRRESFTGSQKSGNLSVYSDNSGLFHYFSGGQAKEANDRLANWKICRYAEILMSNEISEACLSFKWDINDFKAFNKLASVNQGKIAQHLSMVCHLNPPEGFVRISDWSIGIQPDIFDERPEGELNMVVKGIVALVSAVETAAVTVAKVGDFVNTAVDTNKLKGRKKRSRSMRRSSKMLSVKASERTESGVTSVHHRDAITEGLLADRVVHYLAETLVCSTPHLNLDDCELSYNARRGWRAIARALRRKYCSFILPSVFMAPKPVIILSLVLTRNELDCGDCVYIADIFMNQTELKYVDLSYNRIGARGMNRLCKSLREHKNIEFFKAHDNIMGPGSGRDIGLFLKATKCLKLLNLSNNRLGEIVRYPTMLSREKLNSAAHDICTGLRYNKSLEILDLSYNHLGTTLADLLPLAVIKQCKLNTLNIAGNDIGPVHGSNLMFHLSGLPYGARYAKEREEFIHFILNRQKERLKIEQSFSRILHGSGQEFKDNSVLEENSTTLVPAGGMGSIFATGNSLLDPDISDLLQGGGSMVKGGKLDETSIANGTFMNPVASPNKFGASTNLNNSKIGNSASKVTGSQSQKRNPEDEENEAAIQMLANAMNENISHIRHPALSITSLDVSNNQLGPFAGYAIGSALEHMKGLTHLDISGNSLGTVGGDRITDALELCYDIKPREFIKLVLYEIEERKYDPKVTRKPKKRKKRFTNLVSLNISRNGIGPKVIGSLFVCMKSFKCTIVDLNVSDNPIGAVLGEQSGNVVESAQLIRAGFQNNLSLLNVNFKNTSFDITNLITIFGGLSAHDNIQKISFENVHFDEPCCLQLSNVIQHCTNLKHLNVANCRMGANGGVLVCSKLRLFIDRFEYLNLNENYVGPISAIYLSEGLKQENCAVRTLLLKANDLMEEGGVVIARSLIGNFSVTDVDLSNNHLNEEVAFYLADAARGLFKDGVKIRGSMLKKVIINDNPLIGYYGSKLIVKSLANEMIEHFEIINIGAGPASAEIISRGLRDPLIAWKNIDVSKNKLTRHGLNQIFWGLKDNKRLRIINASENAAGTIFCSNQDSLLSHGISVPVMLHNNVCLKELNLSYNTLTSEAGINIIDAIIDNHTIKKLSLRGNLLDDNIAIILPDLFKVNNVLEELDLGYNKLGFACAYAIAEALEFNRSLKKVVLDYNSFGGSGTATLQCFMKSLMMNYSLQYLNLAGNKLGPEWGKAFADIIVRNNTLIQFSLKDNRLDSVSGLALFNAYRNNPYLIELALTADEIGVDLYDKFKSTFNAKRASVHPDVLENETSLSDSQSALIATYHQD